MNGAGVCSPFGWMDFCASSFLDDRSPVRSPRTGKEIVGLNQGWVLIVNDPGIHRIREKETPIRGKRVLHVFHGPVSPSRGRHG